jgi:hypothetical protein
MMNRLTPEERRRVRQVQQQATQQMLTQAPPRIAANTAGQRWRRLMKAVAIAALIGGGWLASQTLEFHAPDSFVEALLPRM